jgi:hypothetical protein
MSRYHNTRKVKLALKVDNALQRLCCHVDARLRSERRVILEWSERDNRSLAYLLRDMSRSHLRQILDEEEQRRTTYELRKISDLKVLNTKKALADAQLVLAGARSPVMRATDRLVRSKAFLVVKNSSGEKTKSARETAQVFCENLTEIMSTPRSIHEGFAARYETGGRWLDSDTLRRIVRPTGLNTTLQRKLSVPPPRLSGARAAMRELNESLKRSIPLKGTERDEMNSDVLVHELRDALVNAMNYKHAGIDRVPYEALKSMLSVQGYSLEAVYTSQLARDGVPHAFALRLHPPQEKARHIGLRDYRILKIVPRVTDIEKQKPEVALGKRYDTCQYNAYTHTRRDASWKDGNEMLTVWLMAFNAAFTERKIPPEWRTAEIIMLHKGGEHDNPNFYRPISLIPTTQKVLHMVIAQRLLRYLLKHRLIEREQIGYLSCEETATHVITLMEVAARRERARRAFPRWREATHTSSSSTL